MAPVKILVVTNEDDEIEIFNQRQLKEMKVSEDDANAMFEGRAYWMRFELKSCTFADQQSVTRECTKDGVVDDTQMPAKRFVKAVVADSWQKQLVGAKETQLLTVSEDAFAALSPPGLGNAIDYAILTNWYPGASKTRDFIREWQEKQAALDAEIQSKSSPSTPVS